MKGREEKYKKLYSKSHEKILKVILQIYKPILMRKPKNNNNEDDSSIISSGSDSDPDQPVQVKPKDYSANLIKVDDASLEKRKREETIEKLMGKDYPHLAQLYISGQITLPQLKQHYYSLSKKIEYICYDELKQSLKMSPGSHQVRHRNRECHSSYQPPKETRRQRPHSASWNYNTKVEKKYESSRITSEVFNLEMNKAEKEAKYWNPSIKVDQNLISEPYRRVCVTNDRKERPVREN